MRRRYGLWLAAVLAAGTAVAGDIDVRVDTREDTQGGARRRDEEQSYALDVTLSNTTARVREGLVLRYWYVGEEQETRRTVLVDQGEAQVPAIGPHEKRFLETFPVKTQYVERRGLRRFRARGVKVEDYVVRVFEGANCVGEAASKRALLRKIDDLAKEPRR